MSTFQFQKIDQPAKCCKCTRKCQQGGALFDLKRNKEIHRAICSDQCLKNILKNKRFLTIDQWQLRQQSPKYYNRSPAPPEVAVKRFQQNEDGEEVESENGDFETTEQDDENIDQTGDFEGGETTDQNGDFDDNEETVDQNGDFGDGDDEETADSRETPLPPRQQQPQQQPQQPQQPQQQQPQQPQQQQPQQPQQQQQLPPRQQVSPPPSQQQQQQQQRLSEIDQRRRELEEQIRQAEEQRLEAERRQRELQEERARLLEQEQQRQRLRDNLRDTLQNQTKTQQLQNLFSQREILDLYRPPIYRTLTPLERTNLRSILDRDSTRRLNRLVKEDIERDFKLWLDSDENLNEIKTVYRGDEQQIFNLASPLVESGQLTPSQIDAVKQLLSTNRKLSKDFTNVVNARETVLKRFLENPGSISTFNELELRVLRNVLLGAELVNQLPTYTDVDEKSLRNEKRKNLEAVLTRDERALYRQEYLQEDVFVVQERFSRDPKVILELDQQDLELLRRSLSSEQIVNSLPTFSDVEIDRTRNQRRQTVLSVLNAQERRLYQTRLDQEPTVDVDVPFNEERRRELRQQVLRDRPDFTTLTAEERDQLRQVLSVKERVLLIPLDTDVDPQGKINGVLVLNREELDLFQRRQFDLFPEPMQKNYTQLSPQEQQQLQQYLTDLEIVSLFVPDGLEIIRDQDINANAEQNRLLRDRAQLILELEKTPKSFLDLTTSDERARFRTLLLPWEIVRTIPLSASRRDVENDLNDREKRWFQKRAAYVADKRNVLNKFEEQRLAWELRQLFTKQQLVELLPLKPTRDQEALINQYLDQQELDLYQEWRVQNQRRELERQEKETKQLDTEERLYQQDKQKFDASRRERVLSAGIEGSREFVDILEEGFVRLAKEFIACANLADNVLPQRDVKAVYDVVLEGQGTVRFEKNIQDLIELIANTVIAKFWGDENIPDVNQRLGNLLSAQLTNVKDKYKTLVRLVTNARPAPFYERKSWDLVVKYFFNTSRSATGGTDSTPVSVVASDENDERDVSNRLKPTFGEEEVSAFVQEFLTRTNVRSELRQSLEQQIRNFIATLQEFYDEIEQFTLLINAIDPESQESEQFEDATLFFVFELMQYLFQETETTGRILTSAKDLGQVFGLQVLDDVIQKDIRDEIDIVRQTLRLGPNDVISQETQDEARESAQEITEERLKRTLDAFFINLQPIDVTVQPVV